MVSIRIPRDTASSVGRATHDVALGALLGANLFGRIAMNPALEDVSDKSERGRVLNRAWRRYGTVNSLALAALVSGWLPARLGEAAPRWLSERERRLAIAKDVAMAAVVVTGLASAAGGVGFASQAPSGAVPMASGHDPAPGDAGSRGAPETSRQRSRGPQSRRGARAGRDQRVACTGQLPAPAGSAPAPPAVLSG